MAIKVYCSKKNQQPQQQQQQQQQQQNKQTTYYFHYLFFICKCNNSSLGDLKKSRYTQEYLIATTHNESLSFDFLMFV